jgi:5-methylcytosine-specific restriction endonuclease McrA
MEKQCFKCGVTQPFDNFYKHPRMADGHLNKCKTCAKRDVSVNYRANKSHYQEYERKRELQPKRRVDKKTYRRRWNRVHTDRKNTYTAERRACRRRARPKWVSRTDLKRVYKNCPEGMVVDHIVPLKNPNVCGLHVPWNLQYLTPAENSSKGNRFDKIQF